MLFYTARRAVLRSLGQTFISRLGVSPGSEVVSNSQPGLTPKRLIIPDGCDFFVARLSEPYPLLRGSESRATFSPKRLILCHSQSFAFQRIGDECHRFLGHHAVVREPVSAAGCF